MRTPSAVALPARNDKVLRVTVYGPLAALARDGESALGAEVAAPNGTVKRKTCWPMRCGAASAYT